MHSPPPAAQSRLLTWRFLVVTAAGLAYFSGWTILYPVLPRFVEAELGGTGASVGTAVGSFGVTAALLRPVAGRLGDRYGRRVLVVGGMIVVALSLVVDSLLAVVALRLLFGAGEAFAFVGLATAIQDMATDDRRGEAANYFSIAVYGGVAAGPPMGEWLFDGSNYDRVWVVAAGLVAVGIVLGLATPSEPAPAPSTQPGWIHPEAILPGLALTGGLFGYAGFVSFVAVYADSIGMDGAGWVFTTYAVLIMAARLLAARVSDRFGALRVSALSLVGIGLGLLIVASFSMFFDLAFALGAVIIGAAVALANERAGFAVGGLFALAGLLPLRSAARRNREPGALHRDRPPAVER